MKQQQQQAAEISGQQAAHDEGFLRHLHVCACPLDCVSQGPAIQQQQQAAAHAGQQAAHNEGSFAVYTSVNAHLSQ
jgi:hypothetical protein